uniref:Uncharacterized protein n=1 Tax=Tanacetum cinerariifolium TaxID=118510 RepID=A0A699HXU8_TANCI|nr:hypothetical protein [Tanacetum cinerariifolium]
MIFGNHQPAPATSGHHRRRRKNFLASFFGEPQNHFSHPDLLDPPHHSPPRATHHLRPHSNSRHTLTTIHHSRAIPTTAEPPSPSTSSPRYLHDINIITIDTTANRHHHYHHQPRLPSPQPYTPTLSPSTSPPLPHHLPPVKPPLPLPSSPSPATTSLGFCLGYNSRLITIGVFSGCIAALGVIFRIMLHGGYFEYWKAGLVVVVYELLWEGIHYYLYHSTSSIPYLRFIKIIIGHYMTNFPEISRRARDKYHNLKDDDIMKNIFNSGRYKDKVGMKIPTWMISEAMKHTEYYWMYAEVFGIDVPLTQSQPTESTQGTFRTPSAPRSTRLTLPTPVPTVDKADEMILQDTLQVSLAKHKSREEQKARENMELVNEHLASVEIKKMVEGQENVIDDISISRNDEHNIFGTRKKGKIIEECRNTPFPTPIRSPRIYTDLVSSDTEKLQELTVTDTKSTPSSISPSTKLSTTNRLLSLFKAKLARFKRYKSFFQELQGRYRYLFEHLRERFMPRKSFATLANHFQEVMVESLPTMVEKHVKEQVQQQVPEQVRDQVPVYVTKGLILER